LVQRKRGKKKLINEKWGGAVRGFCEARNKAQKTATAAATREKAKQKGEGT